MTLEWMVSLLLTETGEYYTLVATSMTIWYTYLRTKLTERKEQEI